MKSPLKWHGGKYYLAPWIISLMPPRGEWHLYREPFFGGGSVLFRLDPEGLSETVNDIDYWLTNFWRVLSDGMSFQQFRESIESTPFSELEWKDANGFRRMYGGTVDMARWFFILYRQSRQGLGKDFATPTSRVRRGMNENVSAWLSAVEGLPEAHERLKRVEIRNMDAVKFIKKYDHEKALFYCDPPYLHSERHGNGENTDYDHEMSDEDHVRLLECLADIKGRFLLSGYTSPLYQMHANSNGWECHRREIDNKASGAKEKPKKFECVWRNFSE